MDVVSPVKLKPIRPRPKTSKAVAVPSPVPLFGKPWMHGDPHEQYRFLRVLGTGHFGAVYLCSHVSTGELVAIKALDKQHPEFERHTALEEVRVLAAIQDHPNVVTLFEVWEDGSYIFIVQEACLGGELFDLVVRDRAFSEQDAARTIWAVLGVTRHAHGRGILLRDLKPENWLLKRRETELHPESLRAVDFGLSVFHHPTAPCTERVGSSYYVAPEVLKGSYSWPADLWSIGVMAYVLLSGFPPFWGSSDPVIYQRILHDEVDFDYEPWHAVSGAAKDFISRLLDKNPATRASLDEALAHPWIADDAAPSSAPLLPEVLDRLREFAGTTRLRKLLLTVAARHLSETAIGQLREVFQELDTDHDGLITVADLTGYLQRTGIDLEEEGVEQLLQQIDKVWEDRISVDEFVAAALDQRKVLSAKTVSAIFSELDRDADGLLAVEELCFVLEECNIDVPPEALRRLMSGEGALDKRGMVSSKSFHNLLLGAENGSDRGFAATSAPVRIESYLKDVQRFAAAGAFKKLAMLVIARQLDEAEVAAVRQLFKELDPCGSGRVTAKQLSRALGGKMDDEQLRAITDVLDLKHADGCIDFDEFLAAALEEQQLVTETKMRAAFDYFDRDHLGVITADELAEVLDEVGIEDADVSELLQSGLAASGSCTHLAGLAAGNNGDRGSRFSSVPASSSGGVDDDEEEEVDELSVAPREMTLTYQDFRRILLNQPPNALTTPRYSTAPECSTLMPLSSPQPSGNTPPIVELATMIDDAWTSKLQTSDDLQCSPRHSTTFTSSDGGPRISLKPSAPLSPPTSPPPDVFGGFSPGPGVRYRDTAPKRAVLISPHEQAVTATSGAFGRHQKTRSEASEEDRLKKSGTTVLQSMLQNLVRKSSDFMRRRSLSRSRGEQVNRSSTRSISSDGSTAAWLSGD